LVSILNVPSNKLSRRQFGRLAAATALSAATGGCARESVSDRPPDKVWGSVGGGKGQFSKPRAIAIDADDQLYIVDMTARIQVFDADGNYIRGWQTLEQKTGRPTGLTISSFDGNLMVADTHYYRILTYTPTGELLTHATLGGTLGQGPGEFGLVSDVVRDAAGDYYISEYGEWDRVQKISPDGKFITQWGGHGAEPGQFLRPQHLELDADGFVWVADACNHRIQVFDQYGKLTKLWGMQGAEPGQMNYPYCLALDGKGHVYVCEYGNHRVQKFTLNGKSIACWGSVGRKPGQLNNPWAFVLDSRGRVHVLDSMNHRVQRFVL
jgi:DNA-binding beta-propeller fold protein YncE